VVTFQVLRADAEGEIDVDARRSNTAGTDTFVLKVKPVGGSACTTQVTLS
jgi:anti-sigma-K factor RskA